MYSTTGGGGGGGGGGFFPGPIFLNDVAAAEPAIAAIEPVNDARKKRSIWWGGGGSLYNFDVSSHRNNYIQHNILAFPYFRNSTYRMPDLSCSQILTKSKVSNRLKTFVAILKFNLF